MSLLVIADSFFYAGCPLHGIQRRYIGMVYDNPPSFGDIIAGIGEIQGAVNDWQVVNISQKISAQERASGGQMLRWGGKALQTEYF